jgi:serralysin
VRNTYLSRIVLSTLLPAACLNLAACAGEVSPAHEEPLSFEEFEAQAYRLPDSGYYVVDGDILVTSRDELRAQYDRYLLGREASSELGQQTQALSVRLTPQGDDDVLPAEVRQQLTYCVRSTGAGRFGSRHAQVVRAMEAATRAWEGVARVQFTHVPAEDDACTASNPRVFFRVSQMSDSPLLAHAFFPSDPASARMVEIDSDAFGGGLPAPITLTGLLTHELGHVLGFVHEHYRAPFANCDYQSNWRSLTSYDPSSVMHYPHCDGDNEGDLRITQKDAFGAMNHYPRGFGHWPGFGDVPIDFLLP